LKVGTSKHNAENNDELDPLANQQQLKSQKSPIFEIGGAPMKENGAGPSMGDGK